MRDDGGPEPLRNRTGRLTLVFLILLAAGLAIGANLVPSTSDRRADLPMIGKPAPEVVVDLFGGGQWRLSDHLLSDDRPVLLNLWASWCEPCEREIPVLSTFAVDHPDVAVIGVAVRDDQESSRALADRLDPSYPIGIDATGRLRDRYLGFGMPALYLIDTEGTIIAQLEGGASPADLERLVDVLDEASSAGGENILQVRASD
jgi:cytochrome c biogenesis protein CcmG, thiol:disulfide interchange protein DsbE